MRYLLVFLFSWNIWAGNLPKELSDDYLKLQSIELMRKHLKDEFYQIDELLVKRVRSGNTDFAVGINNIWESSGKCFSYLMIADSGSCRNFENCRMVPKIVDCS